jgi:hypothetical protein
LALDQVQKALDYSRCLSFCMMSINEVHFCMIVSEMADPLVIVVSWRHLDQVVSDAKISLDLALPWSPMESSGGRHSLAPQRALSANPT